MKRSKSIRPRTNQKRNYWKLPRRHWKIWVVFIISLFILSFSWWLINEKTIPLRGDLKGDIRNDFSIGSNEVISKEVMIENPSSSPHEIALFSNLFNWYLKEDYSDNIIYDDYILFPKFFTESSRPYVEIYENRNSSTSFSGYVNKIHIPDLVLDSTRISTFKSKHQIQTNQQEFGEKLKTEIFITNEPTHSCFINVTEISELPYIQLTFDSWSFNNDSLVSIDFEKLNISLDGILHNFDTKIRLTVRNFGHFQTTFYVYDSFSYQLYHFGNTETENIKIKFENANLEFSDTYGNVTTNEGKTHNIDGLFNVSHAKLLAFQFEWKHLHKSTTKIDYVIESGFIYTLDNNIKKSILTEVKIEYRIEELTIEWRDAILIVASILLGFCITYGLDWWVKRRQ